MRVIAFDPGLTTGWAAYDTETAEFRSGQTQFMETGYQLEWELQKAQHDKAPITVIAESFLITVNTAKNTQAPWSLELIGVIRYMTKRNIDAAIILQKPGDAKAFSSDDKLKAMGFYVPGMKHANDAARHLLLHAAKSGLLTREQLAGLVR